VLAEGEEGEATEGEADLADGGLAEEDELYAAAGLRGGGF
jgi:hypothetical protein